jgi:hypothetical protein
MKQDVIAQLDKSVTRRGVAHLRAYTSSPLANSNDGAVRKEEHLARACGLARSAN